MASPLWWPRTALIWLMTWETVYQSGCNDVRSQYSAAMSIWRNRTVDSDHPEPRRDVGFIIYAVILLSVICLVPIIRLLFLSLVSPSAS